VRVRINGAEYDLAPGATVRDAVEAAGARPDEPGVAVALDGAVVPRSAWTQTPLDGGATIEVLRASAGG
jgi:sulfur carrier protein